MRSRPRVALGCACALLLWPASGAQAGNDDELLVGDRAAMTGGAVSATVRDPSATFYNPGGLGAIHRSQFDVSATVYTLRHYSAPRLLSTTTGQSADGAVTEFVTVPTQIAYVRRLSPLVTLGLGYFVPHASNFVLRVNLRTGSLQNGSQSQIAATLADTQHTAAAAVGIALAPNLRIGGGLIGGYAATTRAISLFESARRGAASGLATQTEFATQSLLSMEGVVGAQVDLGRRISLGLSARTPRLLLHGSEDATESVAQASSSGASSMPNVTAMASEPTHPLGVRVMRMGRAGVALAYRFERGWISGELDAQPGVRETALGVDRHFLVNARAGFYGLIAPSVAIGAGVFTDRSADVVNASFLNGSGDFYGATLGIELSNEHLLAPSEPVDSLVFTTVFALRYAYSDADFGRAVIDPTLVAEGMPGLDSAKGSLRAHELGLYVGGGLQF